MRLATDVPARYNYARLRHMRLWNWPLRCRHVARAALALPLLLLLLCRRCCMLLLLQAGACRRRHRTHARLLDEQLKYINLFHVYMSSV